MCWVGLTMPCALIADDLPDVLEALKLLLKAEKWQVVTASSPQGVLDAVAARDFDVALIDLNYARDTTSGREGFELLSKLAAADATLPVVVMTAWGSIDGAVEAMKRGARDYVAKPWENARLVGEPACGDAGAAVRVLAEEARVGRAYDGSGVARGSGEPFQADRAAAVGGVARRRRSSSVRCAEVRTARRKRRLCERGVPVAVGGVVGVPIVRRARSSRGRCSNSNTVRTTQIRELRHTGKWSGSGRTAREAASACWRTK